MNSVESYTRFLNGLTGEYTDRTGQKIFIRRQRAKLSKISNNSMLRATAAFVLYNEGMQPKLIQRILGHKSLSMTMRYCHDFTSVDEVRNCMQKAFSNQSGFA